MIRILYSYDNKTKEISVQELFTLRDSPHFDEAMVWIDLNSPTEQEEETILIHYFLFHHLAVEDCQRERYEPEEGDHYPKVESYGKYLFVIFNPVDPPIESVSNLYEDSDDEDDKIINLKFPTRQINAFIGKNFFVTHHFETSSAIDYAWQACRRSPTMLQRGPDYLFHIVIDQIVDNYTPLMDYFDDLLQEMELRILQQPTSALLSQILSVKKGVQHFRKITMYQREILNRLARGEFDLISTDETIYYRNVYDHLVRIVDLNESYREIISGLLEVYMSVTSYRLNEVMKVLTMLSTIFLPMTVVTGIYGMNFENMPELQWTYGYYISLGVLVLIPVGMFWYFRRRGWFD